MSCNEGFGPSKISVLQLILTDSLPFFPSSNDFSGSPYDSGLFMFDIFLPGPYNQNPPLMKITTTKGGTMRFNPNLYADGKVCLSLLGECLDENRLQCALERLESNSDPTFSYSLSFTGTWSGPVSIGIQCTEK